MGNSNYADIVAYAPQGAVSSLKLGNGLWETTEFNARLQMTSMALGSAQNGEDKWKLTNTYSETNNNGNILQQTLKTVPGTTVHEVYSYDGANRLTVAGEYPDTVTPPATPLCTDTGVRWCQGFTYDGAGNRKQTAAVGMTQSLLSPTSISSTNNRINATGWSYDAAGHGNVAKDPSNRTYAYDSENRMVAVCTSDPGGCVNAVAAGRTLYEYDADGRRVRKTDATGSTIYVYDAMGQLAAEYGGNQAGERSYLTADQLGSTRVISAADKTITACRDYTPFGEQVMPVSGDFRNSGCYAADAGVKQEFTGKERDGESGLDYFGARYLSSAQGRFTSPDEPFADQYPEEPQSWNLYTYGRNNPLRFTDPDGHCTADGETHNFIWCAAHSFGIVQTYKEQVADARTNLSQMHGFTISGQTPAEIAKSGSAQQVLAAQKQVDSFLLGVAVDSIALCPRGVSCGVALGEGDEFENLADTKGTVHVLEGDSTGGGHAPGLGISGKSEFPAGWSNEKIMHNISDIATDPKSRVQKLGKTTIIEGSRDGVDIKVVVRDGRIVTGYPTNTPRNP